MKRKLGNNDLFSIHWVSDPRIAPNGSHIAYVDSWLDRALDSEVSDVRVVDRSGAHVLSRLAEPGMTAQAPRWSPDHAQLGLITGLDGIAQLWVVELATGAKSGVTGLPGVPLDFDWSPDGGHLVVAVEGPLVDAYSRRGRPARSGQARSGQARSGQARSGQARSGQRATGHG